MEVVAYTAAELVALTESQRYAQLANLPVSRSRAQSHLHNPRLDTETPIIYIAWLNGEVVGYRMVLCDEIYVNDQPQPVCWYSCVWVNPDVRGQGIAKKLVARCLQDWEGRIFGADAVPESRNLYLSTGLYTGEFYLEGTRAYLKATFADIIANKKPKLRPLKPFFALGDALLNIFQSTQQKALPKGVEIIPTVDDETQAFIQPYLQKLLFRRDADDLNWITNYPWIRSGEPDSESKRYYFSSVAKRFEFIQWKLRDESGKMVGYAMLSIRDGHLKTPYVFIKEAFLAKLADSITQFMINERLDTLTTFHAGLARHFKNNRRPFLFVKSVRREYFASNAVSQYVRMGATPNICDGDGDQAFT